MLHKSISIRELMQIIRFLLSLYSHGISKLFTERLVDLLCYSTVKLLKRWRNSSTYSSIRWNVYFINSILRNATIFHRINFIFNPYAIPEKIVIFYIESTEFSVTKRNTYKSVSWNGSSYYISHRPYKKYFFPRTVLFIILELHHKLFHWNSAIIPT